MRQDLLYATRTDPRARAGSQPPASSFAVFGHGLRQKAEPARMGLTPAVPVPQSALGYRGTQRSPGLWDVLSALFRPQFVLIHLTNLADGGSPGR